MYLPLFAQMAEMLATAQVMLSAGQLEQARFRIDKVRLLRSTVKRQLQRAKELTSEEWGAQLTAAESGHSEMLPLVAKINEVTKDISVWLTSVILNVGREELLRSDDGIHLLLDRALPPVWDFNHDIVVLYGENSEHFLSPLVERGQAQIVIVSNSKVSPEQQSLGVPHGIDNARNGDQGTIIIRVRESLELTDEQLASLTKNVHPELISIDTGREPRKLEGLNALARNIRKEYVYVNSKRHWPARFTHNFIDNLPSIYRCRNISEIRPKVAKKDILIVSPGPSLLESLPQLVMLEEHFLVVSLIRSLPVLLDAGVTPDFAIMVDASDHTDERLNLIPDHPLLAEIPLLVTDFTHSSTLQANFSEFILMPSAQLRGCPIYEALYGESIPSLVGSSVATFAVSLFAELEAKTITLIGQDLSVTDKNYAVADQPSTYKDEIGDLTCLGINGEELKTQADFLLFITEFFHLSSKYSHAVRMINATVSGAYLEGWEHMPLNIEHPAVKSQSTIETKTPSSYSGFIHQRPVAEAKRICIDALSSEIMLLRQVEALTAKINRELARLIRTKGIDVTELEALEEQLQEVMQTNGPLIMFYTAPAKLDTHTELSSVASLEENYIASLDYYRSIETSAKRLVPLLKAATVEIDTMA